MEMKPNNRRTGWMIWLAIAMVVASSRGALAEIKTAPLPMALGQGSTLWLDGTSSMHDFESRTSDVTLSFTRDAAAVDPTDAAGLETMIRASSIVGLDVAVPILSMHSGKSGLDRNLQRTLKADKFPTIHFHLTRYALAPASAGRDTADLKAEGSLSIAGHERPANLNARVYRGGSGLWLEGSQALLMTDFDIRPPTMMLGALKVADRITVHYRLLLVPAIAGASRTN
jgi:hypothetical protein